MAKGLRIVMYTDGSCYAAHPDKLGGWAYRWELWDDSGGQDELLHSQEGSFGYKDTTNTRMEGMAMIHGLRSIPMFRSSTKVFVVSDSQFIVNACSNGSMEAWAKDSHRSNYDLWVRLWDVIKPFKNIKFIHVRGHGKESTHLWALRGNARVDELASYKNFKYYKPDKLFAV